MDNRGGLKSALFLMEQLIVILVFALCAAICVKIFVSSYIISGDSKDLNYALLVAENGAECYKASAGNMEKTAQILGGSVRGETGETVTVFYDANWRLCEENGASYILRLANQNPAQNFASVRFSNLAVEKIGETEALVAFTVAAGREAR